MNSKNEKKSLVESKVTNLVTLANAYTRKLNQTHQKILLCLDQAELSGTLVNQPDLAARLSVSRPYITKSIFQLRKMEYIFPGNLILTPAGKEQVTILRGGIKHRPFCLHNLAFKAEVLLHRNGSWQAQEFFTNGVRKRIHGRKLIGESWYSSLYVHKGRQTGRLVVVIHPIYASTQSQADTYLAFQVRELIRKHESYGVIILEKTWKACQGQELAVMNHWLADWYMKEFGVAGGTSHLWVDESRGVPELEGDPETIRSLNDSFKKVFDLINYGYLGNQKTKGIKFNDEKKGN